MLKPPPQIVLASSSPYRALLLKKAKLSFSIESPNVDESPLSHEKAKELACRLALAKATAVAKNWPRHLVIGSDQVAELNSTNGLLILNKPLNKTIAFQQLQACSGKTVTFHTGCTVINTHVKTSLQLYDSYSLTYRDLSDQEINTYLEIEKPFDCAGSIKAEELGSTLIAKHNGTDPATLMGLPMIKIIDALKKEGISPLSDINAISI